MNLAGMRVLVLGAQRTGHSVSRFLSARGAKLRIADCSMSARTALAATFGAESDADDSPDLLRGVDLVVPSPGIPRHHGALREALRRGIPVWSEIELAFRFLSCPILAVTGTNGKSTTTTLLGAMSSGAGMRTFTGGNLGTPLIDAVGWDPAPEIAVAEISSFQLEWIEKFHPRMAVVLNFSPDHLDRYSSLAEYAQAKASLLRALQPGEFAILNRDDPWVWGLRAQTIGTTVSFGRERVEFGGFLENGTAVYWGPGAAPLRFSLARTRLVGRHNEENILAAVTAACTWGLPPHAVQQAIDATEPLPHRMNFVREHRGVRYIDDSKATNVGAVLQSLRSVPGPVILLLGGHDKGGEFHSLARELRGRVKRVVAFGAARQRVARELAGTVPVALATGLDGAVAEAARWAEAGDTVLLSPACASFDEFRDYAERGDRFRALVEAL